MAYRWQHPHEWLAEWVEEVYKETELRWIIGQLASKVDPDSIQDLFQEEMDEQGYFEELDEYGRPIDGDDEEEDYWPDEDEYLEE